MPQDVFPILDSADDGYVAVADNTFTSYPPTNVGAGFFGSDTRSWIYRTFTGTYYRESVGLWRFDTSALPDTATITSAELRFYLEFLSNANGLSLTAGGYPWVGATSDWTHTPDTDAISGVALSSLTGSAYNVVSLTGFSAISLSGNTSLRLSISQRASDAAPTGSNEVGIPSFDNTTFDEPRLTVNYTLPTTRMAPDGVVSRINLPNVDGVAANDATALAAIDEDPDSADSSWLTI